MPSSASLRRASSDPRRRSRSDQVQPASLDLRLGSRAYRVRASFLPGRNHTVRDRLDQLSFTRSTSTAGAILETGSVYIAELQEALALPHDLSAAANPKSSTGRIDVFTRVITDRSQEFDTIGAGYRRPPLCRDFAAHLPGSGPHGHAPVAAAPAQGRCAPQRCRASRAASARARRDLRRALDPGRRRRERGSCGLRGRQPDRLPGQAPYGPGRRGQAGLLPWPPISGSRSTPMPAAP